MNMNDVRFISKKNKTGLVDKSCILQIYVQSPGHGWYFDFCSGDWNTPYRITQCFKSKIEALRYLRANHLRPGETIQIEDRTHHYIKEDPSQPLKLIHTSEYFYMHKKVKNQIESSSIF